MVEKGLRVVPHFPAGQIVRAARQIESWGYDAAWICDEGFTRDIYVTMTAVAAATEKLKVGPGITNPYTRHLAVTAVAMASLNEYSGGRAFFGLGTGGSMVLEPMGLQRQATVSTCRDAITVCRRLWAGERVTYQGQTFRLQEAHMELPPQPMAVWVAARGPQMLAMAAAEGDGVWLDSFPKFALAEKVEAIRRAAAAARRRPKIAISLFVAPDAATMDAVRPYFTFVVVDSPPDIRARLGVSDDEAAEIRRVMNSRGMFEAAPLIRDAVLRHFVFTGSPGDFLEEIRGVVHTHGIDQVILANDLSTASFESVARVLAQL